MQWQMPRVNWQNLQKMLLKHPMHKECSLHIRTLKNALNVQKPKQTATLRSKEFI